MTRQNAFSLVELAIVLVILGLLTGGILAGRALIRASELRSVSTEHARWHIATKAFRDKYLGLPGDIVNATAFWGAAANCPGTELQPSTDSTTCNGNGDSQLTHGGPTSGFGNEMFRYWQQLANAGLVEGQFSGVRGDSNNYRTLASTNVPASKLPKAVWMVRWWGYIDNPGGTAWNMAVGDYGNAFMFASNLTQNDGIPVLSGPEAWNIDTKMDDGFPLTGAIWSYRAGSPLAPDCATTVFSSTSQYDTTLNEPVCGLIFRKQF